MNRRAPIHPYWILLLAIILPGVGHVAIGRAHRGLGFAFSSMLFAILSWQLTIPGQSFAARSAAGLFIWALSIPDAYRQARLDYERWRFDVTRPSG